MKYIKTLYNLKSTVPFERGADGNTLIVEPKNIVFRGQKILTVMEDPGVEDSSLIPYQPLRSGKNIIINEIPEQNKMEYIANCYGILYRKESELIIKVPIQYNKNKTKAYLSIFPDSSGKLPTVEELNALSYYLNIKQQVSSEKIKSVLDNINPAKLLKTRTSVKILFAMGFEPKDGWKKYYILKIKPEVKSGELKEDGSIDFRERNFIFQIKKETPIAEEVPEQEAADGLNIYGDVIKGRLLKHKEYKLGKNIEPSIEDPLLHISSIDGSLAMKPPFFIEVNEKVYIPSDVDYSTGNIDFRGTVEIKGCVISGFKVTSGGDCIIHENIDEGNAEIKGDLYVQGGIHGNEKSMIFVKGTLTAKYLRNAKLHCEGNIFIEDSIINSNIMCRGKITVVSKKSGRIMGGKVIGKMGIAVNSVGSQSGTDTFLGARMDNEISEKIYFHMSQLKELTESKKEISESLFQSFGQEFMTNPKKYISTLPAVRKKQVITLLTDLNKLSHNIKENQFQLDKLKDQLKTPDDAIIEIFRDIYPPTRIQLKESIVKIEKKEKNAKFRIPPGRAEIEVIYT